MNEEDYAGSDDLASEGFNSEDEEWISEEEEDDGGLIADTSAASAAAAAQTDWRTLDRHALEKMQTDALESVINILGCSTSTARSLLMHFRWDTDQLFGALAERGTDFVMRLARATPKTAEATAQPSGDSDGMVSCGCCFCNVERSEATAMECNHPFCNDCWRQHCKVQIGEGNCRLLACMAVGCGAICDESRVQALIAGEPALLERYTNSLLESYVDDNKRVKWCPSTPNCGRAVQIDSEPHCEPQCECGLQFCFACLGEPHSPCSCEIWRMWTDKTHGESENKTWMTANTKPCPKCASAVEKSSGCNLVTCRCGQHFCWLCGGATGISHTWTTIAGHTCGRFKDEVDARIADATRNLKRLEHYRGRWEAHAASQKLEAQQAESIGAKITELEDAEPSRGALKDFTWLTQAMEQLFLARRILGYSYVACFYMFDGVTLAEDIPSPAQETLKNLFEDAQAMLEVEVERLSKLLEMPPEQLGANGSLSDGAVEGGEGGNSGGSARLDIINSSVNIDARLTKLYDLLENDILSRVSSGAHYISPYRGQSTLRLGPPVQLGASDRRTLIGDGSDGPPSPPQKAARRTSIAS